MQHVIGVDWDDLRHFQGTIELGANATGVIGTRIHRTDDELILEEYMPGEYVDEVIASVNKLRDRVRKRRPGGDLVGQIPLPLWYAWRKQWEAGPKLHGVLWRAFFRGKFMDGENAKFRAGNI